MVTEKPPKNYINIQSLERLMEGDSANLKRVLNELLISSIANSERLYMNYQDRKWESLKSTAHYLKGNARYIGNRELLVVLRAIEHEVLHDRDFERLTSLMEEYKRLLSFIKAEITLYIFSLK